ncbi:hypothetical protein FOTG_19137 [Fusarium oxysporum f. sp. vasinfectum 25433]|uniref:Uncharacterized protein n=1 Tax=Fusarium oxysporum f. sp. vasinfectum 25433 TaxID=1089449 RepID=X0KUB0_FUSOX|nr:hypothetical protein FOTG_19137 [Fusarium oxysporum f. sp. vasinfectum 25433]
MAPQFFILPTGGHCLTICGETTMKDSCGLSRRRRWSRISGRESIGTWRLMTQRLSCLPISG